MAVLYRTYRPQKFSEIVGQNFIVKTLQNAARSGDFAHAYLFTGSRGVGKTTIARILAKAANCQNLKDGEVCLECNNCTAIAAGTFLDLVEIDAASNTGVDNVRELIEHVRFQPSSGKYKVFIIDEVHMLSKGAFNALLKTLEEPPKHAIFILATTEIHKVPATIISRTQRFTFSRVSLADTIQQLESIAKKEKIKIDRDSLELIAKYSEGSLRDALSLLGKVATLGGSITLADVQTLLGVTTFAASHQLTELILQKNISAIPAFFDEHLEQGTDFVIFNKDYLEYTRQLLVCASSGEIFAGIMTTEQAEQIKQQAGAQSVQGWMHLIRLFLRALKDAQTAPLPELPMLLAAVEAAAGPDVTMPAPNARPIQTTSPVSPQPNEKPRPAPTMTDRTVAEVRPQPVSPIESGKLDPITAEEVRVVWPQVIDGIRQKNSPLATLVRNSPLESVTDGVIVLRVKYLFHKEHLENLKNQTLVTDVIHSVCAKRVRIKAIVAKSEQVPADAVDVVADALQVFGGELVD